MNISPSSGGVRIEWEGLSGVPYFLKEQRALDGQGSQVSTSIVQGVVGNWYPGAAGRFSCMMSTSGVDRAFFTLEADATTEPGLYQARIAVSNALDYIRLHDGDTNMFPHSDSNGTSWVYTATSFGTGELFRVDAAGGLSSVVSAEIGHPPWTRYEHYSKQNMPTIGFRGQHFGMVHIGGSETRNLSCDNEFFDAVTGSSATIEVLACHTVYNGVYSSLNPNINTIDFSVLQNQAVSGGLLLEGRTSFRLLGDKVAIQNDRLLLGNVWVTNALPSNGVIYVKDSDTGSSSTRLAKVDFDELTGGHILDGQLTIVAENDILIDEHIRYAENPLLNNYSDDVLCLIAQDDVWINRFAPSNLDLHASIFAVGVLPNNAGSFGVELLSRAPANGFLNLIGSLCVEREAAVGTFSISTGQAISGYSKNYNYDPRLREQAPPAVPLIDGLWVVTKWYP